MSNINLITTCTNGKNSGGKAILSLSQFSSGRTPSCVLVNSWCNAMSEAISEKETLLTEDLYKGGHWAIAKATLSQYPIDLWVLSAGLGLLHHKDKIVPYKATFAAGYDESIPLYSNEFFGKTFHRTWWKEITERSFFKKDHPTSITELMKKKRTDYFIICGSPDYINAIELDVINGLNYLVDSNKQLVIITSKKVTQRLDCYLLKSNQNMAGFLNCNMISLNISLARYIVKEFTERQCNDLNKLSRQLSEKLNGLPERQPKKGTRRTAQEVNHYIVKLMSQQPGLSATHALRAFRDEGNSFEEKRFRAVFKAISESKP